MGFKVQFKRMFGMEEAPRGLLFGEPAYDQNTKRFLVGDPEAENGYIVVSEIVEGPHDQNLYVYSDARKKFIPILMPVAGVGSCAMSVKR